MVRALLLLPSLALLAQQVGVAGTMVLGGETSQGATTVNDGRPDHCCRSTISPYGENWHIWSAGQLGSCQLQGGGVIITWGVSTNYQLSISVPVSENSHAVQNN